MSLELSLDQEHLARHKVGYDPTNDAITFLPFVYSANERIIPTAVCAEPVTSCATIEELFLRRSSNMAGIRIHNARDVLKLYEEAAEKPRLTSLVFLDCAERYAELHPTAGINLEIRKQELQRIREMLRREPVFVPDEVRQLMAAQA